MLYKSVIFDFDGTLVDSGPGIKKTFVEMIRRLNMPPLTTEQLDALVGPPLHKSFPGMLGIPEDEVERCIALYQQIFKEIALSELCAFPGILELLQSLVEASANTAIASSKIQPTLVAQAKSLGIFEHIHHICGADPTLNRFEKNEILSEILSLLNTGRTDAVMIGDRCFDIMAAKELGIDSIGVTYGAGTFDEMRENNPTYIVNDVDELRRLLLGNK